MNKKTRIKYHIGTALLSIWYLSVYATIIHNALTNFTQTCTNPVLTSIYLSTPLAFLSALLTVLYINDLIYKEEDIYNFS